MLERRNSWLGWELSQSLSSVSQEEASAELFFDEKKRGVVSDWKFRIEKIGFDECAGFVVVVVAVVVVEAAIIAARLWEKLFALILEKILALNNCALSVARNTFLWISKPCWGRRKESIEKKKNKFLFLFLSILLLKKMQAEPGKEKQKNSREEFNVKIKPE